MSPLPKLTRTESRILPLIAEGLERQEIADALGVSARTVDWHTNNIAQKIGTPNRICWLRVYGEWVPQSCGPPHELPRGRQDCGCCGERALTEPVRVGGMFSVQMCLPCRQRLSEVRTEAEERMQREMNQN